MVFPYVIITSGMIGDIYLTLAFLYAGWHVIGLQKKKKSHRLLEKVKCFSPHCIGVSVKQGYTVL